MAVGVREYPPAALIPHRKSLEVKELYGGNESVEFGLAWIAFGWPTMKIYG
jgi:hypothetical protein